LTDSRYDAVLASEKIEVAQVVSPIVAWTGTDPKPRRPNADAEGLAAGDEPRFLQFGRR
jgi:hypothetical protein